ncbi:unnamed protein product [Lactuca saligna]|uniref:WRKY domain-containing protein n=1 Tax=Lactuca saligna TaxID=75948 RepID=A0AA36A0E1_LACSI|nr:unnamed protein product [Lactuca saligna]
MSEKEDNGGDCGEDDDEWRDLIATPNRLISDDFFVLKSEQLDDREEDIGKGNDGISSEDRDRVRGRRVSIAERRAAMRGNSDTNASSIRVSVSSSRVTAWPPILTIPCGISPTSLLDSPVLLPNSQVSPTTGSFQYPPLSQEEILGMKSELDDMNCDTSSFIYQTDGGSLSWPSFSQVQNQPPLMCEHPGALMEETVTKRSSDGFKVPKSTIGGVKQDDDSKRHMDGYAKETSFSSMRNSEDGYNWRKYGQKQVKGSEYPRSYYKCTHPNCQVKKKVERSHDGHITEIIYKGAHNHQIQGHRSNINGSPDANGSYVKIEERDNISIRPEWNTDRMDRSSSTSVGIDNPDLISPPKGKSVGIIESNPNYDYKEEDGMNIGTHSPGEGDDADDDKSELKRRKKGNYLLETSLVTRAMREPRVVVQIESEVDILDDGYRWRKYGQKVVKGNPNPRSYYKCTSNGCPVRKHVERASDDLKSVLTTYEGKHNHEVPVARNSSHATMDVGTTSNAPPIPLSRIPTIPNSEPQVQDLPLRFDRKISNGYIPSNFVANFDTKPTKFESSSMYQEYIPYQNPITFNSVLPDFPISLPMSMPMAHNFGYNNNGKRGRESFIGGQMQHLRDNNGRFLRPKLEQDDGFYDTFMCAPDHVNDAPSRYCRVIPNFPS